MIKRNQTPRKTDEIIITSLQKKITKIIVITMFGRNTFTAMVIKY